ncbi:alpha/beta hydrolase [Rhizobium sullae]|uniref:Alpha/beta hydrolase n=1 Tax=Rhizobium sullae TaxID=50338 RepID=A0A2N0D1X4_RHISU|nr:alpha/beta hydrolase [Rhizobium sullae]PKA40058.1 alpha/beta hydrolase [Rhizobium sullae]
MNAYAVTYRTVGLGEVEMFYREAGDKAAPAVLLLHGFPTSSHMYRNLIPLLADKYRVIAPDFPGFGSTKAPRRGAYAYTFGNLYKAVQSFVDTINLERFAMMVFDYGAPVGFRLAAAYPNRISAIVTQNGNAYEAGLREDTLAPMRAYWEHPTAANRDALRSFLTIKATRFQYTHGVPEDKLELVSPDAIAHDQAILDRDPEVQLDLFGDYKSNVALYPRWQEYLRATRPPVLAVWGNGDPFFAPAGAHAFRKDVPDAEVHLFDTGHFALETDGPEIAALIRDFLDRKGH